MRGLPWTARAYVTALAVIALAVDAVAVQRVHSWWPVAVFAGLYFVGHMLQVAAAGRTGTKLYLTVSEPVAIAAYIALGPWAAAVAVSVAILDWETVPLKRVFNASQTVILTVVAGIVYQALGGPMHLSPSDFPRILLPTLVSGMVLIVLNSFFVGLVLVLAEGAKPMAVVRDTAYRLPLPGVAFSLFGLLIAVLWQEVGVVALALVLVPLLAARWAMGQFAAERDAYQSTIRSLVQAVETKDAYTRGHSERVARASVMIAQVIGMDDDRTNAIEYAGTLHDVGKLGVPTSVLQKTGSLTDEEYAAIKLHPVRGHDIVRDIQFLDEALEGIYHHHERIDGRGYPMGLTGDQIPEFARVIAVADAFDSMTSTRSYRGARTIADAIVELDSCKDTQFDPVMVDALVLAVESTGWNAAVAPTEAEIAAQNERFAVDDDDPLLDLRAAQ
jgi:HD domain